MEEELTRRGFVVLAAGAMGAVFLKPKLADETSVGGRYLVSVETKGCGRLWPKDATPEQVEDFFPASAADREKEALEPGVRLGFSPDPDYGDFLEVFGPGGECVCDIPWFTWDEDEVAAVRRISGKVREGYEVWGEVTRARHYNMDADADWARVHDVEFDVYYSPRLEV